MEWMEWSAVSKRKSQVNSPLQSEATASLPPSRPPSSSIATQSHPNLILFLFPFQPFQPFPISFPFPLSPFPFHFPLSPFPFPFSLFPHLSREWEPRGVVDACAFLALRDHLLHLAPEVDGQHHGLQREATVAGDHPVEPRGAAEALHERVHGALGQERVARGEGGGGEGLDGLGRLLSELHAHGADLLHDHLGGGQADGPVALLEAAELRRHLE